MPRAYAHMHRAHHAYSDTERLGNVFQNNHHRHGQSPNFAQRVLALFGIAEGQPADREALGSPQVPAPVAESAGAS